MKKNIFLFVLFLMNTGFIKSQFQNLGNFDEKPYHFGFALSINNSDYYLQKKSGYTFNNDSLQSLLVLSKPGFTLGVVSSLNINPNFKIRFVLPSLSFQERDIEYRYFDPSDNSQTTYIKSLRPVYLDFPVLLKIRTDRIKNFAIYSIVGFRYGIDMSSNMDVNNSIDLEEQVIKINKTDYGLEIGGGIDLFLDYFKFGIELKLGYGMKNLHYIGTNQLNPSTLEPTKFDNPIESLRSKVWTVSFTFEG